MHPPFSKTADYYSLVAPLAGAKPNPFAPLTANIFPSGAISLRATLGHIVTYKNSPNQSAKSANAKPLKPREIRRFARNSPRRMMHIARYNNDAIGRRSPFQTPPPTSNIQHPTIRKTAMPSDARVIHAFQVSDTANMRITCGTPQREWMNATGERFAYRCLPMVMANQAGWMIANPIDFTVTWNGGGRCEDLSISFGDVQPINQFAFQISASPTQNPSDDRIKSHFGSGIVTFSIPYLFRTPPEVNLWVKGPSNYVKDGACPLEGIVETDWSAATFTMNWKLTRPGLIVEFKRGEPICMIVPVQRGLAEGLTAHQSDITTNPKLESEYKTWNHRRGHFNEALAQNRSPNKSGWEKDYFQGRGPSGDYFEAHQTQIGLKEFVVKPT